MSAQNINQDIVSFVTHVLQQECCGCYTWVRPIWRVLSKKFDNYDMDSLDELDEFAHLNHINYSDIGDEEYAVMARYMPADMNTFVVTCTLKLREAIISNKIHYTMESWTIKIKPDGTEEVNVLSYLMSVIYYLLTIDRSVDENRHVARAFTLLTLLMRLWRKPLPSACNMNTPGDGGIKYIKYNGEDKLSYGYEAIQNLFISAIEWMENSPEHVKLLTSDVLYDISIIVRMPVSFVLGIYISRLCAAVAKLSDIPIGDDVSTCDVESTKVDLVFSWLYHLLLNTPPKLTETLRDNVGAAVLIFAYLYGDDEKIALERRAMNYANVTNFFIGIKDQIMHSPWFPHTFASLGRSYSRNKEFSRILVSLPRPIIWKIIEIMIENRYAIESSELCGNCLILFNSMTIADGDNREECEMFNSKLLFYTFSPFAHDEAHAYLPSLDKACVERLLQIMYNLLLQPGRPFYKDLNNFTSFEPTLTPLIRDPLNIVNMVSNHMSISWRKVTINQLLINIWCKIVTSSDVVRTRHVKRILFLVVNSNAGDLSPCLDGLTSLIPSIIDGGLDHSIVAGIINVLVRHAMTPGSWSHAYVRTLFHAIFDGKMSEQRRFVAYNVAGCICNNKASPELFKMFRELRLLTNDVVSDIVNIYVTQHEAVAWKLMYRALQVAEYTEVPPYMCRMLRSFLRIHNLCSGFDVDTQLAYFGSLLSIIRYRRARHLIGNSDMEFLSLLNAFLKKCFSTSYCTSQVQLLFLDLVTELRTLLPSTDQWVTHTFQQSQNAVISYLSEKNYRQNSATCQCLFKEISKTLGDMALRLNILPSEQLLQLMIVRVRTKLSTDVPVVPSYNMSSQALNWSTLALLFGKFCLRDPRLVGVYLESMNHILQNGSDNQKSMIIESMADICSLHSDNISMIMPILKEYLARRSYLQVSACQSLLQLLNTTNIRIQRTDFMLLVSVIATEQKALRAVFMKMFEEKLLPNNSDLVVNNFVPMILYFHKVFNHPDYMLNSVELAAIENIPGIEDSRCTIYNSLLRYITTRNKFTVMLKVATDIIRVLHNRRLPYSAESVRMLPDAYRVIYLLIKTIDDKYDMLNEIKELYNDTLPRLDKLEKHPAYLFMNYDTTIKEILVILLAMLEDIHTVHPSMFQDAFHLIIFMIATFFSNVSSMVANEPHSSFAYAIKTLPILHIRYARSFQSYNAEIYRT